MLDIKSKLILEYFNKECENGYKVIDIADIVKLFGNKNKVDVAVVKQTVEFLDKTGYINLKYSDSEVYCLTMLPFGRQFIESEQNFKQKEKTLSKFIFVLYIGIFIIAIIGAFLGTLIYDILPIG